MKQQQQQLSSPTSEDVKQAFRDSGFYAPDDDEMERISEALAYNGDSVAHLRQALQAGGAPGQHM